MSAPVTEPTSAPAASRSLDRSLVRALAWTGAANWATQLLTWAATLITARLLMPSDYGLIGMATMYLGLVGLVSEFGLGQAVITLRDLDDQQVAQINTLSLLFGVALFVLSLGIAWPLAAFFNAPHLAPVVVAMSTAFLFTSVQVVPDALLQKDLRFKLLAHIDTLKAVAQSVSTVTLAAMGYGYWSLALGGLIGPAAGTTLRLVFRRHRFAWPRLGPLLHAMLFSRNVMVSRIAWYGYSNSDFLVAGKRFGEQSLGEYTLAWTIASTPVEKITNMVTRVTPAFFSAVQKDKAELRRYLLNVTQGLALLTFPAALGLAAVAPEFVRIVLGAKWLPAVVPLALLCWYAAMRSITTLLPSVLNATGHSRFVMWNSVVAVLVFPLAFLVASRWGTLGIAAAWIVLYPVITVPLYWCTLRELQLGVGTYLKTIAPYVAASVAMALGVFALKRVIPAAWPPLLGLSALIVAGGLLYPMLLLPCGRLFGVPVLNQVKALRQLRG